MSSRRPSAPGTSFVVARAGRRLVVRAPVERRVPVLLLEEEGSDLAD